MSNHVATNTPTTFAQPIRPAAKSASVIAPHLSSNDLAMRVHVSQRPPALYLAILSVAGSCGIAANILFGNIPTLGINLAIWIAILVSGILYLSRQKAMPTWRKLCLIPPVILSTCIALRGSEILFAVDMLLIAGFLGLAFTSSSTEQIKNVRSILIDGIQLVFSTAFGFFLVLGETPWKSVQGKSKSFGVAVRILAGCLIALPFLLIFGALFSSAEVLFSDSLSSLLTFVSDCLRLNLFLTFGVIFIVVGLMRNAFISVSLSDGRSATQQRQSGLGMVESATVLVLLNALFLAFVVTQFPYFFGGQTRVANTANLVWSDYARKGFFELAWVAGLLVPTIILFNSFTQATSRRSVMLLRGLFYMLTVLAAIIIASALQRMVLYTVNFGLTELRIYVSAFIIMLGLVLVMLNVFISTNRNRWFIPATLVMGFLFAVGIHVPNVQAIIVNNAANRWAQGKTFDLKYLKQLSPDAVPAIMKSDLNPEHKAEAVHAIMKPIPPTLPGVGWLGESVSVKRARKYAAALPLQQNAAGTTGSAVTR